MSDIDTVVVNSLKALDPEWPIREADKTADMSIGPFSAISRTFPCSRKQTTRNFSKWSAVRFLGYPDRLECPTVLSQDDGWRSLGRGRKPNFYLQYLGRENSLREGHQRDGVLIANPQ